MADVPLELDAALEGRLARALDVEGKLPRVLDALGPIGGRDVVLVDGADPERHEAGVRARQLRELNARLKVTGWGELPRSDVPDASADVLIGCWTSFRGADPAEMAEAGRILRPGGRLLAVHDYGRDDVSRLLGERPEYGTWSRRNGPFLKDGFKIRVVHCFWTFDSIEDGRDFLGAAFGEVGRVVGAEMTRPRLSYNLAVYHRTFEGPNGA
jgi:SAM-dependent methyltransferase